DGLFLGDVHSASDEVHGVLNGPAVDVGNGSKADHPDARRADLESQIHGEVFDRAECGADGGRTWHVWPSRASGHANDHAGFLVDHVARCGTGRDEVRSYDRRQSGHELVDGQLHGDLSVPVLTGEWAGQVNKDVDIASLLRDIIEISVHGRVIKGVDY